MPQQMILRVRNMTIAKIENKYIRRLCLIGTTISAYIFCLGAGLVQGVVDGHWVFNEEVLPVIKSVW